LEENGAAADVKLSKEEEANIRKAIESKSSVCRKRNKLLQSIDMLVLWRQFVDVAPVCVVH
jgi:hypothetical protein